MESAKAGYNSLREEPDGKGILNGFFETPKPLVEGEDVDVQPKWFQSTVSTIGDHATFTTFVAGFIFADLSTFTDMDLPEPWDFIYLVLTTLAASTFLGSALLSIFTLIAIDKTYDLKDLSSGRSQRMQKPLDGFGKYEPTTPSGCARPQTPSVHIFLNTKVRKLLAKSIPMALLLYLLGLIIRVSAGNVGIHMYLCAGSMAVVMLPALWEANKCRAFMQ